MQTAIQISISDYTAKKINEMAEMFYSNPVNVKKFEAWHLEKYGRLPEQKNNQPI